MVDPFVGEQLLMEKFEKEVRELEEEMMKPLLHMFEREVAILGPWRTRD